MLWLAKSRCRPVTHAQDQEIATLDITLFVDKKVQSTHFGSKMLPFGKQRVRFLRRHCLTALLEEETQSLHQITLCTGNKTGARAAAAGGRSTSVRPF